MQNINQPSISRTFQGIWIPKEVWLDKRLGYFEKCLLSEIHSLNDPERGCFASNQYFMDFFGERERKIQEGLSKLKNLGYITYENFDGRIRSLRTNLYNDKSFFSTPEVLKSAPLPCGIPHPSLIGGFIEPDNIDDNICKRKEINKEKGASPPDPPLSISKKRKVQREEKIERALRVFTTPTQHESLLKKADKNEDLVKKWYEKLSDWKIQKEIVNGNDYLTILGWVVDAVQKDLEKNPTSSKYESDETKIFDNTPKAEKILSRSDINDDWFVRFVMEDDFRRKIYRSGGIRATEKFMDFIDIQEGRIYLDQDEFVFRACVESAFEKLKP